MQGIEKMLTSNINQSQAYRQELLATICAYIQVLQSIHLETLMYGGIFSYAHVYNTRLILHNPGIVMPLFITYLVLRTTYNRAYHYYQQQIQQQQQQPSYKQRSQKCANYKNRVTFKCRRLLSFLVMLTNLSPYVLEAQLQLQQHEQPEQPSQKGEQQQQQQEQYIWYMPNLPEGRIQQLHNMAIRLEHSIDSDKYACDGYFDYVCGRNRPLYSILGHLPHTGELIQLMTQLQEDHEQFAAKRKLSDFFISCNTVKSLEDCYLESFEYFKPLYGYIITKNYIHSNSYELKNFLEILEKFLIKAESTDNFARDMLRMKLATLKEKFRIPQIYFRPHDLNYEYRDLSIYRESYRHNLKNLEAHGKGNSSYTNGVHRTMLDWCLYLYQSRNKPLSYFYPTLNVHLWMTLYNSSERYYEPQRLVEIGECLKLPQFVNVLEEARILAVVYLKSFRNAWEDYRDWITSSEQHADIYDQENAILKRYNLNNKKLFFTLYAQNFCEFGKDLAENIFYLGLKQNQEFFNIYSCGYQSQKFFDCI